MEYLDWTDSVPKIFLTEWYLSHLVFPLVIQGSVLTQHKKMHKMLRTVTKKLMLQKLLACKKEVQFWISESKKIYTQNLQRLLHLMFMVILISKKVFYCSYLEEFKKEQKKVLNFVEILMFASLEIQLLLNPSFWNMFVNFSQELYIQVVKLQVQLVLQQVS